MLVEVTDSGILWSEPKDLSLEAIAAVSGDSPFVARIGFGSGHAVLVDGVDAGYVIVRDPATGMAGRVGIEDFRSIFTGVIRRR